MVTPTRKREKKQKESALPGRKEGEKPLSRGGRDQPQKKEKNVLQPKFILFLGSPHRAREKQGKKKKKGLLEVKGGRGPRALFFFKNVTIGRTGEGGTVWQTRKRRVVSSFSEKKKSRARKMARKKKRKKKKSRNSRLGRGGGSRPDFGGKKTRFSALEISRIGVQKKKKKREKREGEGRQAVKKGPVTSRNPARIIGAQVEAGESS